MNKKDKEPKKASRYCGVWTCHNNSKSNSNLSYFTLPNNPERAAIWLEKIQRDMPEKRKNLHVCEIHFASDQIQLCESRKQLRNCAIPSLHLPVISTVSKHTQTDTQNEALRFLASTQTDCYSLMLPRSTQTPQKFAEDTLLKRRLQQEIKELKRKKLTESLQKRSRSFELSTLFSLSDKYLSDKLAQFVKTQTSWRKRSQGNRYTEEFKFFALNLHLASPQAYNLLKGILCLPSAATLKRFHIPLSTVVNENLLKLLKVKVDRMPEKSKLCTVCLDTTNIKPNLYYDIREDKIIGFHEIDGAQTTEPARRALVIMVRGIFVNWEQPISFILLGNTKNNVYLKSYIEKVISKLFQIGLDVRALITNIGASYLTNEEGSEITPEKPYFIVNDKKIFYIYDSKHLINLLRNNFMINDFHFNGLIAKWKHITTFYEYDKQRILKLAPKLTEHHISPNNSQKMKIKYATDIFSLTTATAICTCIDLRILESAAKDTVQLVITMHNLFNMLNTTPFSGESHQMNFLYEMLSFFENLRLFHSINGSNCTIHAKFIDGFKITLKSIWLLHEELKMENIPSLATRLLNRECLENFFIKIRQQNNCTEPSTKQLISAFKRIFLTNISKTHGHCFDNLYDLFIQATLAPSNPSDTTIDEDISITVSCNEYNKIEIPNQNGLMYVAGFLLKKCYEKHNNCEKMKQYIIQRDTALDANKEFNEENWTIPPYCFLDFVQRIDAKFKTYFESYNMNGKVLSGFLNYIQDVQFATPCSCFPVLYAKKFYGRLKIYCTLKFNNRLFKGRKHNKMFIVNCL